MPDGYKFTTNVPLFSCLFMPISKEQDIKNKLYHTSYIYRFRFHFSDMKVEDSFGILRLDGRINILFDIFFYY